MVYSCTAVCTSLRRDVKSVHVQQDRALNWPTGRQRRSTTMPRPNEFERRAAERRPMGTEGHHEQANLGPFRIGRPGIHNHPPGRPSTPASERDSLPQAIAYLSAGGESPQPSTESG